MLNLEVITTSNTINEKINYVFNISSYATIYLLKIGFDFSFKNLQFESRILISNVLYIINFYRTNTESFLTIKQKESETEKLTSIKNIRIPLDIGIELQISHVKRIIFSMEYFFNELKKEEIKTFNDFVEAEKQK